MKHDVITEFEIPGLGQGDVLDLTTKIQYEIETTTIQSFHKKRIHQYEDSGLEIIIIPTNKLPLDIKGRCKSIEEYIHPD